jgi:hypothetical protein
VHGAPKLCPSTNIFTPKGSLLVVQREFFEASFSNEKPFSLKKLVALKILFQLKNYFH